MRFQLQQLIELIREKKTEEALEFAQTQLSERGEDSPECLGDMERALALLAFDNPEDSPFSDLLLSSQRHKVSLFFNAVFCYVVVSLVCLFVFTIKYYRCRIKAGNTKT